MSTRQRYLTSLPACVACCLLVAGCGSPRNSEQNSQQNSKQTAEPEQPPTTSDNELSHRDTASNATVGTTAVAGDVQPAEVVEFKPLQLSGHTGNSSGSALNTATQPDVEQQVSDVIEKLKPLQVLLGRWRGTTRLEYEGTKAVDSHEWIWDLQTDPAQPALTLTSTNSPYLRQGRLTWDSVKGMYLLTATDGQQVSRRMSGTFTRPVQEIVGSDDKLHRAFRLEFTEDADEQAQESWQLAFSQQENNRYLLEVSHRRGRAAFRRFDTVSTQRDGTSFAVSDAGYGDRTCIISQGLGTTSVSWQGRTYWVCCSGCKTAFDADPDKWIARAAKRDVNQ